MKKIVLVVLFILLTISNGYSRRYYRHYDRPQQPITLKTSALVKTFDDYKLLEASIIAGDPTPTLTYLYTNNRVYFGHEGRRCVVVDWIPNIDLAPIVVFYFLDGNPDDRYIANYINFVEFHDEISNAPGCAHTK